MQKISFAVVGLNMGRSHVKTILENPQAELVAACDRDDKLLQQTADIIQASGYDNSRVTLTKKYEEILGMSKVDAVVVAVPPSLHADLAVQALESGKHVFCEKPLCDNLENAERICRVVAGSDRVFQIGYCVRSSAFHRKCLEVAASGSIGEVVLVWWHMFTQEHSEGWRTDRKAQGGKLFDCACHYFDILRLWANAAPARVCAFGNPRGESGKNPDKMPEVANVIVDYENGVKGTFSLSQVSVNSQSSTCGIVGTDGKIEGDPYWPEGAGSLSIHSGTGLFREKIEINSNLTSPGHLGFREQYETFINAVNTGSPVACSAQEAKECLVVMLAIDESLATGKVVNVV